MNQKTNLMVLFFGVAFFAQSAAYANSCSSVEREMVQGETAVEFAKDKNGYQEAARLFEEATEKAPGCAAAYYNLGLIYEKTTDYFKGKKALEKYLQLSPDAKDAAAVRKQIYRMEFLAENKDSAEAENKKRFKEEESKRLLGAVAGRWTARCVHKPRPEMEEFSVEGNIVRHRTYLNGKHHVGWTGWEAGTKYNPHYNRFPWMAWDTNQDYIWVRSGMLMEQINEPSGKVVCTYRR